MKLIIDENIPLAGSLFSRLGDVVETASANLTAKRVRDADVLLVRSETTIDRSLLGESRVQFVGTATSGTDHVDLDYLGSRGIAFVNAPGCNANAVKEYTVAALLHLATSYGIPLNGKTMGVVGAGNIGSLVVRAAEALGMTVLQNDPPRARLSGDARFRPLDELMNADIITLHVPLTRTGPDATHHLFNRTQLQRLKEGTIFINTARGGVVDCKALKEVIREHRVSFCIIDTWNNEPRIDTELLLLSTIGTAHIAGHSLDGKINATYHLFESVCRHFHITPSLMQQSGPTADTIARIHPSPHARSIEELLHSVVSQCYDIGVDDRQLRHLTALPPADHAGYFLNLRRAYRIRREFNHYVVELPPRQPRAGKILRELGFNLMDRQAGA